jgi:hypothetical protein
MLKLSQQENQKSAKNLQFLFLECQMSTKTELTVHLLNYDRLKSPQIHKNFQPSALKSAKKVA